MDCAGLSAFLDDVIRKPYELFGNSMGFRFSLGVLSRSCLLVGAIGAFGPAACGSKDDGDGQPACLSKPADATCTTALYGLQSNGQIDPSFQDVFDKTLSTACGVSGCHAAPNPQNGLELDQIDAAYKGLVTDGRVTPGDVECGNLIVRLETAGQTWSMPQGSHLDDETLCSIRHWIKNGAKR
jgi:hypothetical protein